MIKEITLMVFAILFSISLANAFEEVSFKGTDKAPSGDQLILTGKLFKPQGNGSFPAMLIMHTCAGVIAPQIKWAEKISNWGYVVLVPDSFGPRGRKSVCENTIEIPEKSRALDAFDAKAFLSNLPFVDGNRIGIMGFSHGGGATLCAISEENGKNPYYSSPTKVSWSDITNLAGKVGQFKLAIAFYPWCGGNLQDIQAPLLILSGTNDSWCPAIQCTIYLPKDGAKHECIMKTYEGATHAFDIEGPERFVAGHKIAYDAQATADATEQIRAFLKKYLGK